MANEVRLIDLNVAMFNAHKEIYWTESQTTAVCNFLIHQPTIDPESLRPKGRWVEPEWNDMWQSMTATCSRCLERGEVRVRTNEYGMKVINSPCCPNCGAKMEG